MVDFQRARSAEQREVRRRAILDTAAVMLTQMPVADVGLNELARRVGLAKSNVLRYFDSREAVLLELLDSAYLEWVRRVGHGLADTSGDVRDRRRRVVGVFIETLVADPVLCDLFSEQATVLERNISPEMSARFKRSALAHTAELAAIVARQLPELTIDGAMKFCAAALLSAGALWAHTNPSPAMLIAYEQHPELLALGSGFADSLAELLTVLAAGQLALRAD